ncbi:hypothetical protein KX816_06085 [Sphingosinicellaceae bacterium]|nr:hypothetical protein KX816_06085 [Sphingosinicellaceae bacterium]
MNALTADFAGPPRAATIAAPSTVVTDQRASSLFIHIGMFGCLCLQRFCIYLGGSPIYVCLPLFFAALAWMLVTRRGAFRPLPVALYGAVAVAALVSALVAANSSDTRISSFSIGSLMSLLVLYAGYTIGPTDRFDGRRVFDIFLFYVRLCAVLGIAQYLAQFAGIRLFSFLVSFPVLRPILVEPLYNYWPILEYGSSILRSNGFFLVEPSTFSQLLALGIVVDVFIRRDWRFLPLYAVAYLVTYAGTGLLALAVACVLSVVVAPRGSGRIILFGLAMLIVAAIVALAFPSQFASLAGRANEVQYAGSSGYARYMLQFDAFDAVWGETRTLIGYGPGALDRATFYSAGSGNPIVKLFIDYGFIGLAAFALFFITSLWRRDVALVSLFAFANFQLGGGNLLFAPFVVMSGLLCIWAAPQVAGAAEPRNRRSAVRIS